MRLINTTTLRISEFYGDDIPPYAILSHTWGRDEPTYQEWKQSYDGLRQLSAQVDIERGHGLASRGKPGIAKIHWCIELASLDRLEWVWVDTVCIDKTSSAELTEAINSMYSWYRDSVVCYAFLEDVSVAVKEDPEFDYQIWESRWFTRGWTLQELIAPRRLDFYSGAWSRLGSKSEGRLLTLVSEITGIDKKYLKDEADLMEVSFAKKMSWLSLRTTTRAEDMAYCMLGIFDINMPLLYGEGRKAFVRLQEEIIRHSYDHTTFCWTWDENVPENWVSFLAPWPSTFQPSGNFVPREMHSSATPYALTNLGLSIGLRLLPQYTGALAILDAESLDDGPDVAVCIPIRSATKDSRHFFRSQVVARPILLPLGDIEKLERVESFVQTRPKAIPSPLGLEPTSEDDPYLLFAKPTEAKLVQVASARPRPGDVQVLPEGMLDKSTGELRMEVRNGRSSAICRFNLAEFGDIDSYYVFIANHTSETAWNHSSWYILSDASLRAVNTYGELGMSGRLAKLYGALKEAAFTPIHIDTSYEKQTNTSPAAQLPGKWLIQRVILRPLILNLRHVRFLLQDNGAYRTTWDDGRNLEFL